jgi:hypothetical protein
VVEVMEVGCGKKETWEARPEWRWRRSQNADESVGHLLRFIGAADKRKRGQQWHAGFEKKVEKVNEIKADKLEAGRFR